MGAFHLVTQVDTNIILSFSTFNKKQRQNDTCRFVSPNGKHLLSLTVMWLFFILLKT